MEDKEKQIEEMAKVMCGNDCEECARESAEFYKQTIEEARKNHCLLKNCAKTLYDAGYRKIPEDSVVIPKEISWIENIEKRVRTFRLDGNDVDFSQEQIMALAQIFHFKEKQENEIREETAREIIAMLKQPPYIDFVESWVINELAKQFGVSIKE